MLGTTSSELDDPAVPPPDTVGSVPGSASEGPASASAIRVASRTRRRQRLAVIALVCVAVAGAAYYDLTGGRPLANVPPEGAIWFGTSFDPDSYDVRDRLTSVGPEAAIVMVGHLPRSVPGSRLVIRSYLDGVLITIAWTQDPDERAIWGFNLEPLTLPGNWRFEIAEAGGTSLAFGQLVVAE